MIPSEKLTNNFIILAKTQHFSTLFYFLRLHFSIKSVSPCDGCHSGENSRKTCPNSCQNSNEHQQFSTKQKAGSNQNCWYVNLILQSWWSLLFCLKLVAYGIRCTWKEVHWSITSWSSSVKHTSVLMEKRSPFWQICLKNFFTWKP